MNTRTVKEPRSRAAGPSITGYAYQFDLTTLEILGSADCATVTVEGCEDIDIDSSSDLESVQCKYYASANYSLANIRDAILPMLEAFAKGNRRHYRLYVHFRDGATAPDRLTVAELKEALTEHKRKPPATILHYDGIDDGTLESFADNFTIMSGVEFGDQRTAVLAALHANFGGSPEDAEQLHYGNALALVMELAMKRDEVDRKITKQEFVTLVNKRPKLFTRWHAEHIGQEKYYRAVQRTLKTIGALVDRKRRAIILDAGDCNGPSRVGQTFKLIEFLSTAMYGPGRLKVAKPWTVILEGDVENTIAVKKRLVEAGITFNDGYEELGFNATTFETDPIINTKRGGDSISATSYAVRVLSGRMYKSHRDHLDAPDSVIGVGINPLAGYFRNEPKFAYEVPDDQSDAIIAFLKGAC